MGGLPVPEQKQRSGCGGSGEVGVGREQEERMEGKLVGM